MILLCYPVCPWTHRLKWSFCLGVLSSWNYRYTTNPGLWIGLLSPYSDASSLWFYIWSILILNLYRANCLIIHPYIRSYKMSWLIEINYSVNDRSILNIRIFYYYYYYTVGTFTKGLTVYIYEFTPPSFSSTPAPPITILFFIHIYSICLNFSH